MNKELFIALCDRLEQEVPALKWIDADEGQLNTGERAPVTFPCVLIEISYPRCQTLSGGKEKIEAHIQLRIAFQPAGATNANAPSGVRLRALQRYDTIKEVHQALQWWGAEGRCNPLCRLKSVPEKRNDALKVVNVVYKTLFIE